MVNQEGKVIIGEDGLIKEAADRSWRNFWSNYKKWSSKRYATTRDWMAICRLCW
jgi:hypothetical protein